MAHSRQAFSSWVHCGDTGLFTAVSAPCTAVEILQHLRCNSWTYHIFVGLRCCREDSAKVSTAFTTGWYLGGRATTTCAPVFDRAISNVTELAAYRHEPNASTDTTRAVIATRRSVSCKRISVSWICMWWSRMFVVADFMVLRKPCCLVTPHLKTSYKKKFGGLRQRPCLPMIVQATSVGRVAPPATNGFH